MVVTAALLVISLYKTPKDMTKETPVVISKEYKSYDECESDKAARVPDLDAQLEQGLLAYSITCTWESHTQVK